MRHWPHAPDNWMFSSGLYFVSASTLHKAHLLSTPQRLSLVRGTLFDVATEFSWELRAWAVLSNHYHLVARSPEDAATLGPMLTKLHGCTARQLNQQDTTPGRRVWYRFRSTPLTYERSLLARLHYTHYTPARHGVATDARSYEWCSAAWFERSATPAFVKTIEGMKSDEIADESWAWPAEQAPRGKARAGARTQNASRRGSDPHALRRPGWRGSGRCRHCVTARRLGRPGRPAPPLARRANAGAQSRFLCPSPAARRGRLALPWPSHGAAAR